MTAEDLNAISKLLDSKLSPVIADLQSLKEDMNDMKEDIAEIKEDQEALIVGTNELLAWADAAGRQINLDFFPANDKKQY